MMGYQLATHKMSPHTIVLQAFRWTRPTSACINKMQTAMADQINTFNFNGTLAQIAQRYGCPTVTISGGPPLKNPLSFYPVLQAPGHRTRVGPCPLGWGHSSVVMRGPRQEQ